MPDEVKEPHYFAPEWAAPGMKPYMTYEGYLSLFADAGDALRVGEGSVHYIDAPDAARAIYDFNPEASIIIMLRDPVEVMYSYYYQQLQAANETLLTFEEALAAEPERRQGRGISSSTNLKKLLYRQIVNYPDHVQRYLNTFGRSAVHIIIYDDFKADTARVYQDTLAFLGVNHDHRVDFEVVNANSIVRNRTLNRWIRQPASWYQFIQPIIHAVVPAQFRTRANRHIKQSLLVTQPRPPMNADLRKQLQQEFLPQIEQLSQLLERDLTHWCQESH